MTFDVTPFRAEYPWQGKFFDRGGGVRMHYLDEGRGSPLVMVHGNPTWSFYFRNLVKAFAAEHRVIVPDHVGCGLSDKPGDDRYDYTLRSRVDDLDALLGSLGIGDKPDVTLVLHDWGGMIGLAWAMRHLPAVRRLVILNTAGFGLPSTKKLPWQIGVVRHLPFFPVPVRAFNAFSRGANATCSTRPGRLTPLAKQAYLAPYDSWAHRIAVQRFVEDIPLSPRDRAFPIVDEVSKRLDALREKDVLVCWGEKDFVFDRHFLAEWRRRVPEAEFHTFADAGHYVLEDAHEEIVPLIRDFLRRHPLPGGAG